MTIVPPREMFTKIAVRFSCEKNCALNMPLVTGVSGTQLTMTSERFASTGSSPGAPI